CEKLVINSGLDYTVLRASWFNQNFNENYLLENVLAGAVEMPSGNIPEPFIDADDIADAAVAAFTNPKHSNKLYEITGPELLTFKQAFEIISVETGNPISFNELSIDEYRELLKQYNTPDDFIEMIIYLYAEVMDGRNSSVTYDLEKLIDRKPKDFREFVKANLKSLMATAKA
ncbi:MAG: NmrA family transcriptional regulator, partial [Chitinophagaceae bacterium]